MPARGVVPARGLGCPARRKQCATAGATAMVVPVGEAAVIAAIYNEGTDTRLIQDFLGHVSIANALRYTRLAPGRLAAVRVR